MVDINIMGLNPKLQSGSSNVQDAFVVAERKEVKTNNRLNKEAVVKQNIDNKFNDINTGNAEKYLSLAEEIINSTLPKKAPNTKLSIELDDDTRRAIYKMVDVDSGEILHQFPSKEILAFISYYREKEGVLVNKEV